ncbi:hypothetical protein [Corynebacterium nasicanis]|uniref:Uncharacterized protein n=1 Tax=Corynebacterium nasicanis TaxID=1448267 RepID=A0ABW1QG09_9CORY
MSIDRQWDSYLEGRGIIPEAAVVPDHACQLFAEEASALEEARELVHRLLQGTGE